ncbi:MAG: transcriptional regulator NrdR [Chloroflexota bacterium]|nr:transcriptional regulator NrdR [Chloroflexota bacterium]
MKCPYCHHEDTQVTDSRLASDGEVVKRRRRCKNCDRRFTTYERIERIGLTVVKKDNTREEYSRDKLYRSIAVACTKRPVPADQLEEAVNQIEAQLFAMGTSEVRADSIGEFVMQKLRELDEVAYIRFASVYRNFADLEEMREEMEGLQTEETVKPKKRGAEA